MRFMRVFPESNLFWASCLGIFLDKFPYTVLEIFVGNRREHDPTLGLHSLRLLFWGVLTLSLVFQFIRISSVTQFLFRCIPYRIFEAVHKMDVGVTNI